MTALVSKRDGKAPGAAAPRRILVVSDRRLYLEALCEFLDGIPRFDPVPLSAVVPGQVLDGPSPDVVLLDCPDGGDGRAGAVSSVGDSYPGCRTLLLTSGSDRESAERLAASGADAWVSMTLSLADLVDMIDDTPSAARLRPRAAPPRLQWPLSELSERELSVVGLIAAGQPAVEIATTLGISRHTVRTHVQNAMAKMGVRSRTQMLTVAVQAGLRARRADLAGERGE
jgi:DNA-binding NarL/FixJ family response regulator